MKRGKNFIAAICTKDENTMTPKEFITFLFSTSLIVSLYLLAIYIEAYVL